MRTFEQTVRMRFGLSWLLPFGLLMFALVSVPAHIFDERGLPRYQRLRAELQRIRHQNDELRRDLQLLEQRILELRGDPRSMECLARDELGMLRDGEVLFQFAE